MQPAARLALASRRGEFAALAPQNPRSSCMTAPPAGTPDPRSAEPRESSAKPHDRAFFGHPAGLFPLFFTEMWERFSYYGMRSILVLFMTLATAQGGLELNASQAG